jgi:hypothetical protein
MTCEECEQILFDSGECAKSKDWMPGVSVLSLAESHAQTCAQCAAKLAEISKVNDALEQLRLATGHLQTPAGVEPKLLAQFRRTAAARDKSASTLRPPLAWGFAMAVVLVAAAVAFYSAIKPRIAVENGKDKNAHDRTASQVSKSVSPKAIASRAARRKPAGKDVQPLPGKSETVAAIGRAIPASPSPVPSQFTENDDLSLNGGSNVVRVTLPASSLEVMGIPIHPDGQNGRITADVAMDPFGGVIGVQLVDVKTAAGLGP